MEGVIDELLKLSETASVQDCVEAVVRAMDVAICSFHEVQDTIRYGARCMEDEELYNAGWAFPHELALEAMR